MPWDTAMLSLDVAIVQLAGQDPAAILVSSRRRCLIDYYYLTTARW